MSNSEGTALRAGVRQRWSIVTGQDETVREEAEKLVAEAAREAGARHPDNSAAADAWMDLLRREGTYFKNGWVIKQLRVASAKYCSKLASEARNQAMNLRPGRLIASRTDSSRCQTQEVYCTRSTSGIRRMQTARKTAQALLSGPRISCRSAARG